MGDLLRREGLSKPEPRRKREAGSARPPLAPSAPNESWAADFKGWWRTGDGSPFANRNGLAGLTRFPVWLLRPGIGPDRIPAARPARHERMHRSLQQEAASPPSAPRAEQRARPEAWRHDYDILRFCAPPRTFDPKVLTRQPGARYTRIPAESGYTYRPHEALGQGAPPQGHALQSIYSGWVA